MASTLSIEQYRSKGIRLTLSWSPPPLPDRVEVHCTLDDQAYMLHQWNDPDTFEGLVDDELCEDVCLSQKEEADFILHHTQVPRVALEWPTLRPCKIYSIPRYEPSEGEKWSYPVWQCNSPAHGIVAVRDIWSHKNIAPVDKRLRISELVWQAWTLECRRLQTNPDVLKWLWHQDVINPETLSVTDQLEPGTFNRYSFDDVEQSTFHALIGTPNGRSVAHMVTYHLDALQQKTFVRIHLCRPKPDRSEKLQCLLLFELA